MSHSPVGSTARLIDDDDVRVIVVGLRELGQLLADQASGFTVATIDADADARAEIAQRVRGSSRAGLFFVLADSGDGVTDQLAERLPAARFRTLVLTGLHGPGGAGAPGSATDDPYLARLASPFTANDVLAALGRLPDAPPLEPIPGGDAVFGVATDGDGLAELDEILGIGSHAIDVTGLRVVTGEPRPASPAPARPPTPAPGRPAGREVVADLPAWAQASPLPPPPPPPLDGPPYRPPWPASLANPPVMPELIVAAPPPRPRKVRGRVLGVCSYKGGSGKTTTALLAAATLARAVADTGKRVVLVDANTAQSSVSTVLQQRASSTILNLVRSGVDEGLVARALTPLPEAGFDVLFGAPDLRSADEKLITPVLYRRIVSVLRSTYDYVIVDTPVAEAIDKDLFNDFVLPEASYLVIVVDPNRETIENNLDWLDIISDPVLAGGRDFPAERIGVLLNRAVPDQDWTAEAVRDQFRRWQFLGAVPSSRVVARAANNGRLLSEVDPEVEVALRRALHLLTDDPDLAPPLGGPAVGGARALSLRRLLGRR